MTAYYGLGVAHLVDSPAVVEELEQKEDALTKLTLFGCGLEGLEGLPPLRRLRELVLASNALGPSLGGALFPEALLLPRLTFLDVSANGLETVDGGGAALPALTCLVAARNELASLRGLAQLAPRLELLDVRENAPLRDAAPLRSCDRLADVRVEGC